jgi:hypothetical protein
VNDSEMSDLARLAPAPAARDLPTGRQQILKEHLMTEFKLAQRTTQRTAHRTAHRTGRGPKLAIAAAASVLAVSAVATAVILVPGSQNNGSSPGATLLAKFATAAERQPAPRVGDGEFMYIRSEVAYATDTISGGHETSVMAKPHERQVWLPVANICATGLLIENGSRTPLGGSPAVSGTGATGTGGGSGNTPQFTGCGEGHVNDPTYRLLQSLPTDPHALLTLIYAQTKGEGPSPDAEAFTTIGDLMRETIVPPQTAAALYRAAALIPGVTVVGHATDAAGRAGVAVAWTVGQDRDEWIFDPATGQFLGELDYNTVTGAVTGESSVLQRAFTTRAGQLP